MRFHMGVSFSWRIIKKFLIYIIFGLLAFFGFSFLYDNHQDIPFGSVLKVFADSNSNTTWNLTMQDYDTQLKSVSCGNNGTMYDVVNNFIDNYDDTYYNLTIGQPWNNGSWIVFYLVSKDYSYDYLRYEGQSSGNRIAMTYPNSGNNLVRRPYFLMYSGNCSDYQDNTEYQRFYTLYTTNQYISSNTSQYFNYNNYNSPTYAGDSYYNLDTTLNNNSSYNTDLWFYYSTIDYKYASWGSSGLFSKSLYISDTDTTYVISDNVPSYYDLYHQDTPNTPTFIGYKTSLDTFYTSIAVNDVNSYQLKFKFDVPQSLLGFYQTPQEYIDNTSFDYICSGRVNNSNYYTYENFNCSLSSNYTNTDSSIEYTFNNFTTSKNLSSYDKIYITLNTNYLDRDVSTTIYNLTYTYSFGDFYNTSYKGSIYEKLTSLPLNFRLYFSSNNSLQNSSLYVSKYNFINYNINYIGFSNTSQQQNLVIGSSILGNNNNGENVDFISTSVSNNIDTGIMIYQNNGTIPVPSLEMFFNGGFVLSLNTNLSSDTFYYIDNEGVIQSNNYSIPIQDTSNNVYDISYYVGLVNTFIDDLSNDSLQFSYLTQNFYNSLPIFFQNFIFIIFILVCIYFTYKLIKK